MRISKKILAAVLAALMVIAMMPVTALAEYTASSEPFEYEVDIWGDSAEIGDWTFEELSYYTPASYPDVFVNARWEINEDIVVTSPIVIPEGANVQIDLNGHSISGNIADSDGKKLFQVYGQLEFIGDNGGCVYNTNVAGQGHAACQALTGGTVIVNAPVTFGDSDTDRTNANAVNRGCGIQNNGGTLIINDGYYTAIDANYTTGAWAYAILNCEGNTTVNNATVYGVGLHGALGCEEGTLTVNGGTFAVNGANNYYSLYCDGGVITVNGGTFTDNSKNGVNYVGENSATYINGGTFTYSSTVPFVQKSSKANPVVTGGTFSGPLKAAWMANGYVYDADNNAIVGAVKNGENNYTSLAAAIAAAQDCDTIELLADLTGNGISVAENKFPTGLTVNFNGYTYTCNENFVGSTGTQRQVFQLLKGNTINFVNGTITSNSARMLIQNYSALTLDGMTLNHTGHTAFADKIPYALSNNNGSATINDTTINACEDGFAFDACRYNTYNSVSATVTGDSVINGNIEVSASAKNAKDGLHLALNGGTINGNIVLDSSVETLFGEEEFSITKGAAVVVAPPAGYVWADSTTLAVADTQDEFSITDNNKIDLNIYVDTTVADVDFDKVKITYSDPTKDDGSVIEETKNASALESDGDHRIVKVTLAPAQVKDTITVDVLDDNGEVQRTIETSVEQYCETIIAASDEALEVIAPGKVEEIKDLAKSTLDYGKATSDYFSYNTDAFTGYANKLDDPDVNAITTAGNSFSNTNFTVTGVAYVATAVPELRFYVTNVTEEELVALNQTITSNFGKAQFVQLESGDFVLRVTGIDIVKFGQQLVVSNSANNAEYFSFVPISWAKFAAGSTDSALRGLGKSICNYYLKSVAYFGID